MSTDKTQDVLLDELIDLLAILKNGLEEADYAALILSIFDEENVA